MKKNTKKILVAILSLIIIIVLSIFMAKKFIINKAIDETLLASNQASQLNKASQIQNNQQQSNILSPSAQDIVLGDKDAPVTIIEYASLSCPHCASFYKDGFSKLKSEYIDQKKVRFIYRDFPLNKPALAAANLALCQVNDAQKDIKKYHNFIKALFRTQESWAFDGNFIEKLKSIAKLDGMDPQKSEECMGNIKLQERVLTTKLNASKNLNIRSTPSFFINGELISGYTGYKEIKSTIEKKLLENK